MDPEAAARRILRLENDLRMLKTRIHHLDWKRWIVTFLTALITGGTAGWLFG